MFMTINKVKAIVNQLFSDRIDVIEDGVELVNTNQKQTDDRIDELVNELTKLRKTVDELNNIRDRKNSDEPWFEIYGGDVDPENGLELRLDWNDAFIKQLKLQGYKGITDDELIAQYIANIQKMVDKRGS